MAPPLRPRDADLLRAELRAVRTTTEVPMVFGGPVDGDTLQITELLGTKTNGLRDLRVPSTSGLGGRVIAHGRPELVASYRHAPDITHDFDGPVLAEGISAVAAMPVVVAGKVRAVLYAAVRGPWTLGDRVIDGLGLAARRVGRELGVRDEVDRRLSLLQTAAATRSPLGLAGTDLDVVEELRALHAELRGVAAELADGPTRDRLQLLSQRLAQLGATAPGSATQMAAPLTHREIDVLAEAALGCANAEIARRLSLRPETVKSYLRSAALKLDTHTRQEAVVAARRLGLLP